MRIADILFGVVLLLMGRQFFWVFVAVIGFLYGFEAAALVFPAPSDSSILLVAVAGGLIGTLLAILLQPLAAAVSGFLAGGYVLSNLFYGAHWANMEVSWVLFILGGIIGFILVVLLFDWALIILSSLIGTGLLLQNFSLDPRSHVLVAVFVFGFGVLVQSQALVPAENTAEK